jgi:uncharacterized repeat protein (TIGR01451 family)
MLLLFIMALLLPIAQAAELIVNPSGSGGYTTISAALADANYGDTICVQGGSYSGFPIFKDGITLIGENNPTIAGTLELYCLNCQIKWFTINAIETGILGDPGDFVNGNTITGNTINAGTLGIYIPNGKGNTINANTISSNIFGIEIDSGSGNVITGNKINSNGGGFGIGQADNTIYYNCVKSSGNSLSSSNTFITASDDYYYNGRHFTSRPKGNYWSDYTGVDGNFDGIGDDSYNGRDPAPIMNTFIGWAFLDANRNGIMDPGEVGLADQLVTLSGVGMISTSSAAESLGEYSFPNLAKGSYTVSMAAPAGYVATTPTSFTGSIDCAGSTNNFGFFGCEISGRAWNDRNYDGKQDPGEADLPGVAVELQDQNGNSFTPPKTTTTDSIGRYKFQASAGSYRVRFTSPTGKAFSPKDQGDDGTDSDADPVSGLTAVIATIAGGFYLGWDAGLYENQIIINEIYPNPVGSDNQAGTASWERVELKNVGSTASNVGLWTIRDDDSSPILATIPANTIISPGEYLVVHIGGSSSGISNSKYEIVHLSNYAGVEMDQVGPLSGKDKEGLSYSCIPDASNNWGFWGEPTFGGSLTSEILPGAPNMVEMDYGDAPDTFKTLRAGNGARHFAIGPYLGSSVDSESDGQPSASADGDGSDEDGAVFSDRIIVGTSSTLTVTASAAGVLQAWLDFNGDGDFEDAGEHIASDQSLFAGETKLDFSVPADAKTGDTYARLRFSSASGLACYGLASDGEVEDYLVKITPRYTLGDYVWVDENGDGVQDAGEKGLEGVTVNLRDSGDNIVSSQTSTADGEFLFENPAPGTYNLEFLPPAGYSITSKDAGTDDTIDSDADPATYRAGPITVVLGLSDNIWDAGIYLLVSISGMKFHDQNANGLREVDEPPLPGWDIQLKDETDNLLKTVTTSSEAGKEGTYEFVDLQPGTYRVYEVQKDGWVRTAPAGGYHTITLTNMPSEGNLFGNNYLAISGLKFHDKNANGQKEDNEPLLSDWKIQLKDESDNLLQTATTSSEPGKEGTYEFADLQPGTYRVYEVQQKGWVRTAPEKEYHTITLTNMLSQENLFGNVIASVFSGMKFEDSNGNGVKDSGDPGLAGWTIRLNKEGTEVASTETAADGTYSFVDIAPGSYTVEETAQAGWTQSYPATGKHTVELESGVAGPTNIYFGNWRTTGFSGMKFEDINGNGAKDSGEPGLEGWTIKLMKEGTQVASTETAADGTYSFDDVAPGSYTVEETVKDGWIQTYPTSSGTYSIIIVSGEVGPTDIDFGNWHTTGFSGMKFEDLNGNGARDSVEPGLVGWTIKLKKDDTEVASTETAADGTYSFADVAPGCYTVEESAQDGWTQTSPAGNVYTAVSSSGEIKITRADQSEVPATSVNFGNRKLVEAFQVAVTANQQNVLPGQKLVFYITINRDSNIDLNSMTVEYTLPKGLNFVNSNHSPLSVTQNADGTTTITWTFVTFRSQMAAQLASSQRVSASSAEALASSTSINVTTEVRPDAPQSLTGTVVVTGTSSEAIIAESKDTVSVNVEKMPDQPVHLNKTSDLKEVWAGATIGYTITYETLLKKTGLTDVVITEQASSDLIFLSATPAPDQGTDNVWSIGQLDPGEKGTINVFFQVKNTTNLSFSSQSSVSGSGFVSSYRRLSTETESQGLRNIVTLTCKEFIPVSTSYLVKLRDSDGTSLLKTEHGSGDYRSEEVVALQMQNRSISTAGSLKAVYRPTSFSLPGGKSINYDSEISSSTISQNRATQASTSQQIRYAKSLEMDEKLLVDKNETLISVEGSMQGQAHLGVLKKDGQAVKPSPVFESSQDYTGSFRFNQSLEDYGSNVLLVRNATGQGQAASDQRLKKSQRSYEHGNGSYQSEELISSAESYMAKDLSVSSDPAYGYGKWKSGIWSRSSGLSYLGQEISGADYIQEETKAGGLNDLSSNLSYRGQGRFRAAYESGNRSMLDLDEEYMGEYSLQRKVHLGGTSRFDRPHLTLNKTGRLVPGTIVADYTITVQNDGNTALGPVYVWDIFPAGTDYLSSSQKPNRLQPGYANWSLLYLSIGQSVTISLRLNLTDPQDELVNLVYASGGYDDEWVTAGNMSVLQFGWLGCCQPDMLLEKQARIDPVDSRVIWYRILLQNRANVSLAAQITDSLPVGLQFLNASAEPQVVGQELIWVTTAIPAGQRRFIEYRVQAAQNGRFVNTARVQAHALDGSGGGMAAASATVTVGEATSYAEDGWKPPEWGLDRMEMICDDEIAGDGGSCNSCPSCSCAAEGI